MTVLAIVVTAAIVVAIIQLSKNRHRIKFVILNRLNIKPAAGQRNPRESEQSFTDNDLKELTAEESKAELGRLQKLIEGQKQIAWDMDISHHLWGLYNTLLRNTRPHSLDPHLQDGEWYDVKILHVSTESGVNKFDFELKGARYKIVDDEEKQGWREKMKVFSLILYDESGRCLMEVPMKMRVDSEGRRYSISSDGPKAFLPGDWINDFINVELKNRSIRNQEIRAQKHQERLREIEDLKNRFGIRD